MRLSTAGQQLNKGDGDMTMRHFSPTELERMESDQESSMQDICTVLTYTPGSGTYGYGPPSYTVGPPTPCGFNPRPREVMGDSQVEMSDGTLRLPVDTVITHLDRVALTRRFGRVVFPQMTFEILGQPAMGPSGLVLNLRRVTDGSSG